MEREGYCQKKEEVKENAKVFVLSNWVEDSGHVLLWGRLGEQQIGGIKKFSFG